MVKIYKLEFTVLQLELLRYLYLHAGERYNARTLAKSLGVSPTAVMKALPELAKLDLIKFAKEAGRWLIELNRDNPDVIALKRAENLKLLSESGLTQYLYNSLPGTTIILFGSFAFGDDIHSSDIDIAVIGTKEKHLDLHRFEKLLEKKITLNYYPSLELDRHLRNNLLNGIVLKGSISL